MQLSNFKNALGTMARKDTSDVVISEALTINIVALNAGNRTISKAQAEFVRKNPEHQLVTDNDAFVKDLISAEPTKPVIDYVANVVVQGWSLLDDDGKPYKFSIKRCVDLLSDDTVGPTVLGKIIAASRDEHQFEINWESVIAKNS